MSVAKFVAETENGQDVLTFYFEGDLIPPAKAPLNKLPVPGSIEATLEDYKVNFPEDTVEFEDNRTKGGVN